MSWPVKNRRWILQASYEESRPRSPRRNRNAEVRIGLAAASAIPTKQRPVVTVEHSRADRPDLARPLGFERGAPSCPPVNGSRKRRSLWDTQSLIRRPKNGVRGTQAGWLVRSAHRSRSKCGPSNSGWTANAGYATARCLILPSIANCAGVTSSRSRSATWSVVGGFDHAQSSSSRRPGGPFNLNSLRHRAAVCWPGSNAELARLTISSFLAGSITPIISALGSMLDLLMSG